MAIQPRVSWGYPSAFFILLLQDDAETALGGVFDAGKDRRGNLQALASIRKRPEEVEGWRVPGRWEGDFI